MEPSVLWSTFLLLGQRFPNLFLPLILLGLAVPLVVWVVLLGGFRYRGYHHGLGPRHPRLGFASSTGLVGRARFRLSTALRRGFRFPSILLVFLPALSRQLRAVHGRISFGFGPPLSLLLLFLLTAYTISLALALIFVHWQEFVLALQAQGYLHWDWSNPRVAQRTDLEYRWWLKWFWRQSTLGQGYFRGFVRLGRGGPGPRLHLRWKRPPRNLGYWLGVWRYRTPFRPFKDRALRARWFIARRHPFRLLRWLLGLVFGLLFLQSWALTSVLVRVPYLLGRTARRPPRIGSSRGRQFGSELDRLRDFARKANWVGGVLLLFTALAAFGWPPIPLVGLASPLSSHDRPCSQFPSEPLGPPSQRSD